jgi:Sulfite oxidase and related enzymes
MKKYVLIVVSILLVASMLAGCGSKAASLITVSGKIAKGTYELTEATFTANATELQYHDPWVGDSGSDVMEKGILLKDLITLVKPSADATTVALICTDGKEYDVSMADAQNYNIMLVHWVAGTVLDNKTGGPVKVAYPADATNYTNDAWAWWVVKVEFK